MLTLLSALGVYLTTFVAINPGLTNIDFALNITNHTQRPSHETSSHAVYGDIMQAVKLQKMTQLSTKKDMAKTRVLWL